MSLLLDPRPTIRQRSFRIGLVSTYPPRQCGLATFAAALGAAVERAGHRIQVVRIQDGTDVGSIRHPVSSEIVNGDPRSVRRAALALSNCDVVLLQHEYGIFGGADGCEVLELIDGITAPVISVLHTVPLVPTDHQRSVLVDLCTRSARVVVMSAMAAQRLTSNYPVDECRLVVIPHGAATVAEHDDAPFSDGVDTTAPRHAPELLTWGLLGPGKGIEHVIEALALLDDITPRPRYTVAGVTHPKVLAHVGDGYRQGLIARCRELGLASRVEFDDTYRDVPTLTRFIASAFLVVLPYDSRDQVTSGVLVDALAAGTPVVATAFPHALEMLSSGAGVVVPHADPGALARAIRWVLQDRRRRDHMATQARRIAPSLSWAAVARAYLSHVEDLIGERQPVRP